MHRTGRTHKTIIEDVYAVFVGGRPVVCRSLVQLPVMTHTGRAAVVIGEEESDTENSDGEGQEAEDTAAGTSPLAEVSERLQPLAGA